VIRFCACASRRWTSVRVSVRQGVHAAHPAGATFTPALGRAAVRMRDMRPVIPLPQLIHHPSAHTYWRAAARLPTVRQVLHEQGRTSDTRGTCALRRRQGRVLPCCRRRCKCPAAVHSVDVIVLAVQIWWCTISCGRVGGAQLVQYK